MKNSPEAKASRMPVKSSRKIDADKEFWTEHGAAFEHRKTIKVLLHSVPVPNPESGQIELVIFKEARQRPPTSRRQSSSLRLRGLVD